MSRPRIPREAPKPKTSADEFWNRVKVDKDRYDISTKEKHEISAEGARTI